MLVFLVTFFGALVVVVLVEVVDFVAAAAVFLDAFLVGFAVEEDGVEDGEEEAEAEEVVADFFFLEEDDDDEEEEEEEEELEEVGFLTNFIVPEGPFGCSNIPSVTPFLIAKLKK